MFEAGIGEGWRLVGHLLSCVDYRKGKYIGVMEWFRESGRPSLLKHDNAQGKEDGPWKEWWRDGKLKGGFVAENGRIISGSGYYPDGSRRIRYENKYAPTMEPLFKEKRLNAEAWAPNGKSTGRVRNGNGEWTGFSETPDSATGHYTVFREVYKDSLMIKGEERDGSEIARWLK